MLSTCMQNRYIVLFLFYIIKVLKQILQTSGRFLKVGKTPLLGPGDSFEYCSAVTTSRPGLCMQGVFHMKSEDMGYFDAIVGPFKLLTDDV